METIVTHIHMVPLDPSRPEAAKGRGRSSEIQGPRLPWMCDLGQSTYLLHWFHVCEMGTVVPTSLVFGTVHHSPGGKVSKGIE